MLTAAAEAGVVELSRLAVRLTCSSHISSEQLGARFSRRGVRAAEKISEVGFLYGNPGRHAQLHTNHKPPFHSQNNLVRRSPVSARRASASYRAARWSVPTAHRLPQTYCRTTAHRLLPTACTNLLLHHRLLPKLLPTQTYCCTSTSLYFALAVSSLYYCTS